MFHQLPSHKPSSGKPTRVPSRVMLPCVVFLFTVLFGRPTQGVLLDDYTFEEEIGKEIPCHNPPHVANGETIVWGDGLLLEYRCKPGFFAVGITHGACDLSTGMWTIDPPVCVDKGCPELTPPSHGVVNVDNSGGIAHIVCRQGYFLLGDTTLICETGQWKGVFPVCAATAKLNEKTKSRKDTPSSPYGGPSPDHVLTESDETCFYNQITPPEIQHAVVDTSYVLNEVRQRYVIVATYTCMGGFRLRQSSRSQLFCQNMVWSAPVWPQCIAENDPCELDNGGCHHYCTPTGDHSYSCSCYDGYNLAGDAKNCTDANECAINNGDCEQDCFNTDGSFFCSCKPGFTPKGSKCIDIDECIKAENICPGPCINLPGSFRCDCDIQGFVSTESMDHCKDIDECAQGNGGCDDLCINKRGGFECRCETKGRKLGEDGRSCVDVDECTRYKSKVCPHGQCVNNDGSYSCVCASGYRQSKNETSCEDIDECVSNNGGCSHVCLNTPGSFKCACQEGFVISDGRSGCRDVNECVNKKGGCEDYCINTVGSYRCVCTHVGKVLAQDGHSCRDCTSRQFYHKTSSSCVNCPAHAHARDGLALSANDCRCDKGFHGNPGLPLQCQDTNECHTGALKCSHQCVNTIGSAHCACPEGYSVHRDGISCQDVNECKTYSHNCSQICENSHGSYRCRCMAGYRITEDGRTCTDVDECATGLVTCPHGCYNTEGGYSCTCDKGYQLSWSPPQCMDVDECKADESPCEHKCVNTEGSYTCLCDGSGFKLSVDGSSCIDINECMEGDTPCPHICVNTIGSYLCDCDRPGYRLSNHTLGCEDIDECGQVPSLCMDKCINTPGSFRCACPEGYELAPETNQTVCTECDYGTYRAHDDPGCKPCPPWSNTTNRGSSLVSACQCVEGYGREGSGHCTDINECETGVMQCQHECVNTEGDAHCTCRAGYLLNKDKTSCDDINECATLRGGCQHKCVNSPGSFHCECRNDKYKLADNGLSCEDAEECDYQIHGCEYKCAKVKREAVCTCPPGHELLPDGKKCVDSDECLLRRGGCTGTCVNTPGSFRCECNVPGFRLFKDGKQCVDINECLESKEICEDTCINAIGTFNCRCRKQGYALAQDRRHCEDIDECAKGKACRHRCINLPGSFACDCDAGYSKLGSNCKPCDKGSYRSLNDPVVKCVLCPPGMTTSGKATESARGCFCPAGYYGNPEKREPCSDVDECQQNNGHCDQLCNNTVGSFHCSCKLGYTLQADDKTCVPAQCPILDPPMYSRFTTPECTVMGQGQPVSPGTECSFKCAGTLLLEGSQSRTCLNNFTWSGSHPTCTGAYSCDRPASPSNGYLYPPLCTLPSVPFRTRCQFRCDKGYKLEGRGASKCRPFNTWSGNQTARCVAKRKGAVTGGQETHKGAGTRGQETHHGAVTGGQETHQGAVTRGQETHQGAVTRGQETHQGAVIRGQETHQGH